MTLVARERRDGKLREHERDWPHEGTVAARVDAARQGSQRDFDWLYRRYAPMVHGILLSRYRPAVADELTQDCFESAFARLHQLREAGRFGPWIASIARHARPLREFPGSGDEAIDRLVMDSGTPDAGTEAAQALAAITALPEAYRETLVLRLVEGMSGAEIAAATGLTPASVRVNLHRGMTLLRHRLGLLPGQEATA